MCEVLHASLDYIVKGSTESVLTKLPSVTMKTAGVPNASTEDDIEMKSEFLSSVKNIIVPYNFDEDSYEIILHTIKGLVEVAYNRASQVPRKA
jgi:hypothetical protein